MKPAPPVTQMCILLVGSRKGFVEVGLRTRAKTLPELRIYPFLNPLRKNTHQ